MVNVELIFVAADQTVIHQHLSLAAGATVEDAITASGIINQYPEVSCLPVGIFSKLVTRTTQLSTGDRVELYRPLTIDPKEKRRLRSLKKKSG